jgi:gamma-glutamyl hercynylcysteine S-oxide synthase
MKSPARLQPPSDWKVLDRDGFVVHIDPLRQSALSLALSVAAGLDGRPRRLDARYLYDAAGSDLFDRITAQPEYYLTRAEDRLLAQSARTIRETAGPGTLVELGSGASQKTEWLLDAWCAAGPTAYVPVEVDLHSLERACAGLRRRYPSLPLEGLAASYERALPLLPAASPMTLVFLGSSLGNLGWKEAPEFCQSVADALRAGDHFLIGLDLVKKPSSLEAAYNDDAGVTAAFTRNLFARMNRELLTDISPGSIEHVAFYDSDRERIEIYAEARQELLIRLPAIAREFRIARGERILTEISHKFRRSAAIATVERFGFRLVWTDQEPAGKRAQTDRAETDRDPFGLFLFRKIPTPVRPGQGPQATRAAAVLLAEGRARTLEIVAPLTDEDLQRQHSRLMSPIAWDLGHIAHFEELWLLRDSDAASPDGEQDAVYDPLVTPRARRDQLALPSVATIRHRLFEVRGKVEARLASRPGNPTSPTPPTSPTSPTSPNYPTSPLMRAVRAEGIDFNLVVQHEAQHQETILQAIALRDDLDYRPPFASEAALPVGFRPPTESLLVPGGPFVMGTDERLWAYDNERPAHPVDVADFKIDACPVTNGQYLAFMQDGGYTRRELWSEAGWSWREAAGARSPAHWRATKGGHAASGGGWEAIVFGRLGPLHPDCPVVHVSWYEADTYARWAGGRLPSEAEWEKAAAWDPAQGRSHRYPWGDEAWEPGRANLDQRHLEPVPAGAALAGRSAYGCLQMLGDVWEWTESWFDGYPGFQSFPYREYSEIFFGKQYRVLRGGSFATRATVARTTTRNWDLPERRQIFAGFRCVRQPHPARR